MSDILVAYYSRTGTTETVALALADRLGAKLDRISSPTSYAGAIGFARGIWHAFRGISPPIKRRLDPTRFRVVVLCAPVWAGTLAAPARAYLRQAGKIPRICGVALSGGGGQQVRFFREIERLSNRGSFPRLSLAQRQVADGTYERLLEPFAERVQAIPAEAA